MLKLSLNSKINSLLKNTGRPPLVEIIFLGYGGAFDFVEKNSSCILKTSTGTVLIDCGSTVYSELRNKNLVDDINYVFITHCHEDHIGSLSTLVYHKYFKTKTPLKIECVPEIKPQLELYLKDVCGHTGVLDNSFVINSNIGNLYKDLNMIVHKISTTGFHVDNFPTCGFVVNLKKGGENFFVVYSGDINVPFTDIIKEQNVNLYNSMLGSSENVFVFHEATTKDLSLFSHHCALKSVDKIVDIFPNTYVYHHGKEELEDVLKENTKQKTRLNKIIKSIDQELNEKLKMVDAYESKEILREQAKRLKDGFIEDSNMESIRVQFVGKIGNELVIQEELGNI